MLDADPIQTVSLRDMFGTDCVRAVDEAAVGVVSDVASFGVGIELSLVAVVLATVYYMVRRSDIVVALMASALGIRLRNTSNDGTHIFDSEIMQMEYILSAIGVVLFSLASLRIVPMCGVLTDGVVRTCLIVAGAIAATVVLQWAMLTVAGIVAKNFRNRNLLLRAKLRYIAVIVPPILPLATVMTLSPKHTTVVVSLTSLLIVIAVILFVKETFLIFRTKKLSFFYWILYLCTVELLPLSLLVAPIIRG